MCGIHYRTDHFHLPFLIPAPLFHLFFPTLPHTVIAEPSSTTFFWTPFQAVNKTVMVQGTLFQSGKWIYIIHLVLSLRLRGSRTSKRQAYSLTSHSPVLQSVEYVCVKWWQTALEQKCHPKDCLFQNTKSLITDKQEWKKQWRRDCTDNTSHFEHPTSFQALVVSLKNNSCRQINASRYPHVHSTLCRQRRKAKEHETTNIDWDIWKEHLVMVGKATQDHRH